MVSNDTSLRELENLIGVSKKGLLRWNKSGKAPATLKAFILGTKYRPVSNDTSNVSNDTPNNLRKQFDEWSGKRTFFPIDTIYEFFDTITGS